MEAALIATLEAKTSSECEARAAEAEREANAIVADAQAQADALRKAGVAREADALAFQERRATMVAESEAEREGLAMQQAVIDEALRRALAEFERIAGSTEFGPLIESLLASAMEAAPEESVVTVPDGQLERCQAWLKNNGHARATVEGSKTLKDGVSVRDRGKTYRVIHTLTSRYEKLEREARKQCQRLLFPEGT
jgi:vacuolar-type H+-ATPase subunit E/Vma4